jgi:hypothetical protein
MKHDSRAKVPNTIFKILTVAEQSYLIVLARGGMNSESLAAMFRKISDLAVSPPGCRVLIDLEQVVFDVAPVDLHLLFSSVSRQLDPRVNKLALVAPSQLHGRGMFESLGRSLRTGRRQVALFDDAKSAVNWLSGRPA